MRAKPVRSRTVAVFTAHAVIAVECPSFLVLGHVERVAVQAFLVLLRLNFQDAAHPFAYIVAEHHERMSVLVAHSPGAVLVLQNSCLRARLHTTVTARRAARTGSVVLSGASWNRGLRVGSKEKAASCQHRAHKQQRCRHAKSNRCTKAHSHESTPTLREFPAQMFRASPLYRTLEQKSI